MWIAAQGDRVPIKCRLARLGPPVQPWDRLYRPPYEPRPLLKPGRAALRNLGPGNKRKIGFVCQGVLGCRAEGGLKFEGDQGWKLKEVLLGERGQHVCLSLCRRAFVMRSGLMKVYATAYVTRVRYGIHTLQSLMWESLYMFHWILQWSRMYHNSYVTQSVCADVTGCSSFK